MTLAKSSFVDANSRRRCEDCSFQTEKSPLGRSLKNKLAWNIVELEMPCFCCLFSELDSRVMQDDACKEWFCRCELSPQMRRL